MNICGNCERAERGAWGDLACVNGKSERRADYVDCMDGCDGWEPNMPMKPANKSQ